MAKQYFMPRSDEGKARLFLNIGQRLPGLKTALKLEDADVTGAQARAAYFSYVLNCQTATGTYGQQWTAYKNNLRDGTSPVLGPEPVAPTITPKPAACEPGVVAWFNALINRIRSATGYTDAIGEALGIIGAEETGNDDEAKPVIKVEFIGDQVIVRWKKKGMSALEIWVDRGDGKGSNFLATDSVPDYVDTYSRPPAGQAAVWKYTAIYHVGDQRVGQWSDTVTIAVAGK